MADRKLFGTDGVRGVANLDPMIPETAMRLGMAIAARLKQSPSLSVGGTLRPGRIVIGKDTRRSGYMFEPALTAGLVSMGAHVIMTGPLPTPGIAYLTSSMRADAGVVISASHNPYQDNGIKVFSRDGFKLPDSVEAEIEELFFGSELDQMRPGSPDVGRAVRIEDAAGRYVVFLKGTYPRDRTLDGVRIVVDCAHGAAYKVAPLVFQELGAATFAIGVEPDGFNINDGVGALHPQGMCATVRAGHGDLGIALDGDADRVIFSDEKGRVVDGDAIMAICARSMIKRGVLRQNTLVATVMSNIGLERAVAGVGGRVVRTQVGDRYVVDEMRKNGYNLGGEQSGHLIFLDHSTTGDGIVAALAVLAIMGDEQKPLSELAACYQASPQVLVNVKVNEKRPLEELPQVQAMIRKLEQELGADGRILVRYSGTEPKARVMIEGPDQGKIQTWANEIAQALEKACA